MSTNYYIRGHTRDMDPEYHIGKRVMKSFIWAMTKEHYSKIDKAGNCPCCELAFLDQAKVIEDEYHQIFTKEEFEKSVLDIPQRFEHVGTYFG